MPIVTFHLVDDQVNDQQSAQLLQRSADLYSEVLEAPVERIRGFIQTYPAARLMVGGNIVSAGEKGAPYFEFVVFADRTPAQVERLFAGFTDLLVEVLGVDASVVRGRCVRTTPEDWCISGMTAAALRGVEIAARQAEGGA